MNELAIFENKEFGKVRVVVKNNEPWFVLKDICDILDISNHRDAHSRLSQNMKGVASTDTPGGKQDLLIVSEAGIYKLVFTSRKPEAEKFTDWVAGEIIPAIRRTGSYFIRPKSQVEALLESVQLLAAQEKRIAQLEDKAAIINHRIDNLDLTNIEGTPRQRLVKMVQRYANQKGITYNAAWHEFTSNFNTAYRTNLSLRIGYTGRKISKPEYLEEVGEIEDAIRVADKMLNETVHD